jgi:hypothetical protein
VGAERRRAEKLAAMLDEPLVQRHLRVCWEHRGPEGNCCRCEKCLRTMLILHAHGRLADFPAFAPAAPLADLVDRMPAAPGQLIQSFTRLSTELPPSLERAALERLLARSQPGHPVGGWRAIWKPLARRFGR